MKRYTLILLCFITPFFTFAQKQTNLGIGSTFEKISENDLFLPGFELNIERAFNNNFSLATSLQYGKINNSSNNLQSLNVKATAFYALFQSNNHKIKVGAGVGYRNISNHHLVHWSENGNGEKYNQQYSDRKYSSLGFHLQIEDDWKICNRFILTPNVGYQYLLQDVRSICFGMRISYSL